MRWPATKLCVSFFPENGEEAVAFIHRNSAADFFELRLDRVKEFSFEVIPRRMRKKLIITCRLAEEGGGWRRNSEQRLPLFQQAVESESGFIDVEWKAAPDIIPKLPAVRKTNIILSHHSDETRYDVLWQYFMKMHEISADVYKLIFRAKTPEDVPTALRLQDAARETGKNFVIHAMGDAGEISRIMGALNGNYLTYVAASGEERTAEGQISLSAAKKIYRLPEKRPPVKILGLVGNPVAHSPGWRLHNSLIHHKLQEKSEDYIYLNFPVQNIKNFWRQWESRVRGLSVTLPYKQSVVKFLDDSSPEVRQSGVCNTMIHKKGRWMGYNTDLLALKELFEPHRDKLNAGVLIIGTGGTARSALAALYGLGVTSLFISGRNSEKGRALADEFAAGFVSLPQLDEVRPSAVIQTTPLGMFPKVDEIPPGTGLFRPGMIVFDVVYNPAETRFLQIARKMGCVTISGLEMFLRQAALQFELFTGFPVSDTEIRQIWGNLNSLENEN